MARKQADLKQFLDQLDHPRKAEIQKVRAIILNADGALMEQIKWNAPSFGYDGEDRVTFRLQPGDRVQLVFHRGAQSRDGEAFAFEDSTGLLEWVAEGRGIVTFVNMDDVADKEAGLADLVRKWMQATNL